MKILGIIKEVDESQEFIINKFGESIASPCDANTNISESVAIKRNTYKSFLCHFPKEGNIRIAPFDETTNEILLTAEKTQEKSLYYENEYHKLRLELKGFELKLLGLTFFKRLKFLFTKKLD
jgi:hypothetical protein